MKAFSGEKMGRYSQDSPQRTRHKYSNDDQRATSSNTSQALKNDSFENYRPVLNMIFFHEKGIIKRYHSNNMYLTIISIP